MLLRSFALMIILLGYLQSCSTQNHPTEKINGVSFVASRDSISDLHVQPIVSLGANYAAIMPFGFIRDLSHPEIMFNSERQWFGERNVGAEQYIKRLKLKGIHAMLKPQIWVSRGSYTGHIEMDSEDNWKIFEASYETFILNYAQLAAMTDCEMLCIGTELEYFIRDRPEFWKALIQKIRLVYKGKLTYAANWDEFKRVPFWDDLDYIGIDAYFPIDESKNPSLQDLLQGWKDHKKIIHTLSVSHKKPILFTEFGYRSIDFTAREPWKSDHDSTSVNLEAQSNATRALLETFWPEPWFAGGFVWKWHPTHHDIGGDQNNRFTPQNKPAEAVIREFYKAEH